MDKRKVGLLGALLALVLFFAVNIAAGAGLRTLRLDLTEEKLFTLSDGAKKVVEDLEEPIRLTLYVSTDAARLMRPVQDYADRVRDVLEEFVVHSGGKVELRVIDPEPFSEEEEHAVRDGVAGIPLSEKDVLYFGLVGSGPTSDQPEVIPFFGEIGGGSLDFTNKERFLDYDIARLIYTLSHPDKRKVGVLSSLPIEGSMPENSFMMRQEPTPRWKVLDQIGQFFELTTVDAHADELPPDLDLLCVIHPRDLSQKMLFAIDQYVLGGGKLVAFVDPHCEADKTGQDPSDPMSQFRGGSRASDLNTLFKAWGLELVPNKVAGDRESAASVQTPGARGQGVEIVPYMVWLDLEKDAFDPEDPITSTLSRVLVKSAGILRATDGATTTFEPLLHTSQESMEYDVGRVQFMPEPQALLREFVSGYQSLTLAARISGDAQSAFPDGPPDAPLPSEESAESEASAEPAEGTAETATVAADGEADAEPAPAAASHLTASTAPIHVIAVADVDLLEDGAWLQEQRLGPINLGFSKLSDNADFLVGAIENLLGGEELTSIRARGRFQRPFEKVEEMRVLASQRYQSEKDELERQRTEIMRSIEELLRGAGGEELVLTEEQNADLERKQEELVDTNRRLREIRHGLNKDIERLETELRLVNIGLIPFVMTLAACGLFAWRIQRRGRG
jgi:ABC-type uncharacterized transport system involved in gliding motility auxiliary subunit